MEKFVKYFERLCMDGKYRIDDDALSVALNRLVGVLYEGAYNQAIEDVRAVILNNDTQAIGEEAWHKSLGGFRPMRQTTVAMMNHVIKELEK
jgi:hypothetical protein